MGRLSLDLTKWVAEQLAIRRKAIVNAIYIIMREKFGILDTEGIKNFALKHNCALCYDTDRNFIGISVNNRWLYTVTGQAICKKGKRWMIEKINYGDTNKERLQRIYLPRQEDERCARES